MSTTFIALGKIFKTVLGSFINNLVIYTESLEINLHLANS